MITGMHHGGVYCLDIEESISFYESLGFRVMFRSNAMEGDKPLKMAWVKAADDCIIELLEQDDKEPVKAASITPNHIAMRTDDIDAFAAHLQELGIEIEAGPLDPPLEFDRPLAPEDASTFVKYGDAGAQLRIMFFRGPSGERFEAVQDNIGAL